MQAVVKDRVVCFKLPYMGMEKRTHWGGGVITEMSYNWNHFMNYKAVIDVVALATTACPYIMMYTVLIWMIAKTMYGKKYVLCVELVSYIYKPLGHNE